MRLSLKRVGLICIAVIFNPLSVYGNDFTTDKSWKGRVVGILDGDTIDVLKQNESIRIRLQGVDAPEKKQAFGQRAKQYLSLLIFGKVVTVSPFTRDRYGRIVASVFVNDESVSALLVRRGFAWHYVQYSKSKFLSDLEETARKERTGLWKDNLPIAPWDWRRKRRLDSSNTRATSQPSAIWY